MTSTAHDERAISPSGAGALLRGWRARRRISQLDLSVRAEVSTRHLSYVETGRSTPSRELLLHLARHLDVPHREQNDLLLAAGYAPAYSEIDLDDPAMQPIVHALRTMLDGNEPNPTIVMDRHWNLVLANASALAWIDGVDPSLLDPPVNVMRLTTEGLADRIVNIDEVTGHLLHRLRREVNVTGDPVLVALLDRALQVAGDLEVRPLVDVPALPVRFRSPDGSIREYLSTVATFGAALDVTASELTIETFYDVTAAVDASGDTVSQG